MPPLPRLPDSVTDDGPADLPPGSRWLDPSTGGIFTVSDAEVVGDRRRPRIASAFSILHVETVSDRPCIGPWLPTALPRNIDWLEIHAELDVDVPDEGPPYLLDVWVVPTGDALPVEGAGRFADGVSQNPGISPDDPQDLVFDFHTAGTWDVHLRVRDALTGEASETVVLEALDLPMDGGCAQAGPATCASAALALVALRRHRRRPEPV